MRTDDFRRFISEYIDEALSSANHSGPLERSIYRKAPDWMRNAADELDRLSAQLDEARAAWRRENETATRYARVIDKLVS